MATTQGLAVAWGASVETCSAVGTITSQGETFKHEADSVEVKNESGDIVSKYYYNTRKTLSLSCHNTDAASMNATPAPGSACTVAAFTASGDTEFDGIYIVESCSKERAIDGVGKFSLDLVEYDNITPS
tara:strand:+ start:3333 stop:3719 length:387 start_codon:yes stop_codon:yes gene_type:complete